MSEQMPTLDQMQNVRIVCVVKYSTRSRNYTLPC